MIFATTMMTSLIDVTMLAEPEILIIKSTAPCWGKDLAIVTFLDEVSKGFGIGTVASTVEPSLQRLKMQRSV